MYLRKVSRQNAGGNTVTYFQVAENIWDSRKRRSCVRVVCTLGRADDGAVDRLRQLVRSIHRQSPQYRAEVEGWKFQNSWEHGPFYVTEKLWQRLGIKDQMVLPAFTDKEIQILVSVLLAIFVLKIAKRACKSGAA